MWFFHFLDSIEWTYSWARAGKKVSKTRNRCNNMCTFVVRPLGGINCSFFHRFLHLYENQTSRFSYLGIYWYFVRQNFPHFGTNTQILSCYNCVNILFWSTLEDFKCLVNLGHSRFSHRVEIFKTFLQILWFSNLKKYLMIL